MKPRSIGYVRLVWVFFLVGLLFLLAHYVGRFSVSQSQVLCLLVFIFLARHTLRPEGTLPPLRITILPRWEHILVDEKLIDAKDIALLDSYCAPEGEKTAALLQSMEVDVLSSKLFYSRRYNTFTTEWSEVEDMFCRLSADRQALDALKKSFPSLFSQFSLRRDWMPNLRIDKGVIYLITAESLGRGGEYFHLPECGIQLAVVPRFLFTQYCGYLLSEISLEEMEARFIELGWTRNSEWDNSEFGDPWPWTEYHHKYFTLRFQFL